MSFRPVSAVALALALTIPSLHAQEENLALARKTTASTLERYRARDVTLVDLLQTINREASTSRISSTPTWVISRRSGG